MKLLFYVVFVCFLAWIWSFKSIYWHFSIIA